LHWHPLCQTLVESTPPNPWSAIISHWLREVYL
jgi:hypothetical protein